MDQTPKQAKGDDEVDAILAFAEDLAKKAGKMILEGQQRRFSSKPTSEATSAADDGQTSKTAEKLNSVDLVTEVDQAVEAFIIKEIEARWPGHKFIGEETYKGQELTDEPTWIVDPIDGTTNFVSQKIRCHLLGIGVYTVHGFPFVACSIGVAIGKKPVVGVIYNPFLDQLYSAATGRGAYLNSTTQLPLTGNPPPPLQNLSSALVGVEWGSARSAPELLIKSRAYERLAGDPMPPKDPRKQAIEGGKMVHSLRSLGSAALNICMVATGGQDVYWEIGCWPWDVCAGIVILQEAGGMAFGSKHGDFSGEVTAEVLTGRKYLFIRPMSGREPGETARQGQLRIMQEFYQSVDEYDP